MFDTLTVDEMSELQEILFSGMTSAIRAEMLVDGSVFWQGIKTMKRELESLYRDVSDQLGIKLWRQPVGRVQ